MAIFVNAEGAEFSTIDDTVARALMAAGYVKKGDKPAEQPAAEVEPEPEAEKAQAPKPKRATRAKAKADKATD